MTQEEKELLLKDLCARLPYGVKGNFLNSDGSLSNDPLLRKVSITYSCLVTVDGNEGMVLNGDIKPYLFPLSSMTEEQKLEYKRTCTLASLDWLNKNHFDYRGLIPMGLAIDATGKNIY